MTTKSITRATGGQKDQIAAIVAALVKKLVAETGIDQAGAQKLISDASAFKDGLRDPLMAAIRAHGTINSFANEEVPSRYGYLSGYRKPNPAAQEMTDLKRLFPQVKSYDEATAAKELVPGAEGSFLIPRWQTIAPTYCEAVEIVLAKLKETRNGRFYNYREGQLGPDRLRESAKKVEFFQKLGKEQEGHDVLVVQAQFGIRHRGRSVQRARFVMGEVECGLGAFEIGIMLLLHPERLQHFDDLWIDASGDEYAPGAGGVFSYAPCFFFSGGTLEFDAGGVGRPDDSYGSASAFVVVVPSE